MKITFTISAFLLAVLVHGQGLLLQEAVTGRLSNSPVATLAAQLTKDKTNDRQRVAAIFNWITDNIDYRVRAGMASAPEQADEDTSAIQSLEEHIAELVLQSRVATCFGYARLFKSLCDHAGIRSEIITGYARTNIFRAGPRFKSNHNWNAVWIDSAWHLLDATWASGFISYQGNNFIRQYDDSYFMADPQTFIRDHYPDDIGWTLLCDPPVPSEFRNSPYHQKSFTKYKITGYSPSGGIIETRVGDTINIQLELGNAEGDRRIGSDPFLDTASFHTVNSIVLSPASINNTIANYNYVVNSASIQWLYILYNDDIVLRYRLRRSSWVR